MNFFYTDILNSHNEYTKKVEFSMLVDSVHLESVDIHPNLDSVEHATSNLTNLT